ncbi:MAG TPA: YkgJ family cysteine cluster protein [Polyangiaceae bacterium]|nr:YkgJ family cysteine cluster protein [Polyangiaceae bacterium]
MSRRKRQRGRAHAAIAAAPRPSIERDSQGRVHLLLQRDPRTGDELVALKAPLFREPWQDELSVGTANTARALLRATPSVERAVELARTAMAATSRLGEALLARAPAGAVACRAGCDHCCYQPVGLTPPEALAIAAHLRQSLAPEELVLLAARLSERVRETRGLSSAERFSPEHPCPFLERGQCSIYEVRPLSCRGMNSLDAEECKTRLRDPVARAAFLERGSGGRSFMEPIRAFHAISAGLQLGLSELYGLDMRPLELSLALDLLLNGPDSSAVDWLNGLRPFEAALGGDNALPELGGVLDSRGTPPR